MMTLAKQNCVVKKNLKYEKYPAQMLEVAGDLRWAPAKFENPEQQHTINKNMVSSINKRPKFQFLL